MICLKIYKYLNDFYYNYINYHKDRCYECKQIPVDTGHCECWYFTWNKNK